MKKVYTSSDNVLVGYLQGILQDQKINCLIKNEMLQGATGEIPAHETWPEIWVMDDNEEQLAKRFIEQALTPNNSYRDWKCLSCGEWIESQFTECWKCNSSRPMTC